MISTPSDDAAKLFELEDERDTLLAVLAPLAVAALMLHRELYLKGYRSEAMGRLYDAFSGIQLMADDSPEFCALCDAAEMAH